MTSEEQLNLSQKISQLQLKSSSDSESAESKSGASEKGRDITALLHQCAKEMQPGQLIHTENFDLWNALSAVELMSPFMDSGMNLKVNFCTNTAELFLNEMSNHGALVATLNRLFQAEMTWLSGFTLAQTCWTASFLHKDVQTIPHPVIRAYSVGLLKSISLSIGIIVDAQVVFEEDISCNLNEVSTLPEFSLEQAETLLTNTLATLTAEGSHSYTNIFRAHLMMRKCILLLLQQTSFIKLKQVGRPVLRILREECLPVIMKAETKCDPIGFDNNLTAQLTTGMPARVPDFLSLENACNLLSSIVNDLEAILNLPTTWTVSELILFLSHFGHSNPNILSRSMYRLLLMHDKCMWSQKSVEKFVQQSVERCTAAPYFNSTDATIRKHIESFFKAADYIIEDTIRVACFNSGRRRRNLFKLVSSWDALQVDTEQIDQSIHERMGTQEEKPFYLANWVYSVKLYLMSLIMEYGFHQELYESYEFVIIYWYMDYLYGVMREQAVRTRALRAISRGSKNKPSKKEIPAEWDYLDLEEAFYSTAQELSRGLYRFLNILTKTDRLKSGLLSNENEEIRLTRRFGRFSHLSSPYPISYSHFVSSTEMNPDAVGIWNESVLASFNNATGVIQSLRSRFQRDQAPTHDHRRIYELQDMYLAQWEQAAKRLKIAAQLSSTKRDLRFSLDTAALSSFISVKVQLDVPAKAK